MAANGTGEPVPVPWYKRWQAVVLAIGALCAAVLSILALWDRLVPDDTEDVATITSANVSRQSTLNQFTADALEAGLTRTLGSADVTMSAGAVGLANVADPIASRPEVAGTTTATPPTTTTTTPPTTTTTSTTTTPTPTEPTTTTPPTPPSDTRLWTPTDEFADAVVDKPVLDDYEDVPKVAVAYLMGSSATEPADEPPTPADVAEQLAQALGAVNSSGESGHLQIVGWVVAVNLKVDGFKGDPLLLTWSLDRTDAPQSWVADNVAYRVIPGTEHETASLEVWVPDLSKPGTYNVNLTLVRESDGKVLTRGGPVKVDAPKRST